MGLLVCFQLPKMFNQVSLQLEVGLAMSGAPHAFDLGPNAVVD
jgi:hypothetical protein